MTWHKLSHAALAAICGEVGVDPERAQTDSKNRLVSRVRRIAWRAMLERGYTPSNIGRITGANHSSVINGARSCTEDDLAIVATALSLIPDPAAFLSPEHEELERREDLFWSHAEKWRAMWINDRRVRT